MLHTVLTGLAAVFILCGSLFALVASLGLLRLPDVYARMHAASKAGTVGAGLILLAFILVAPDVSTGLRALLTLVFFVLTAPVAAHLLARAASQAKDPAIATRKQRVS